jgi:hypothetical protein
LEPTSTLNGVINCLGVIAFVVLCFAIEAASSWLETRTIRKDMERDMGIE